MTIRLEPGQSCMGTDACTIDNITSNAIVVLKRPDSDVYAAINLDVANAPKAEQIIEDMIKQYTAGFRSTSANELEAIVIGGRYREHRETLKGYFVWRDHLLVHNKLEEALAAYEIRTEYLDTDMLATKTILIEKGKIMLLSQKREGNNRYNAVMSEDAYERIYTSRTTC